MMPLGTIGRTHYRPYATFGLIIINVLLYGVVVLVHLAGEEATRAFFSSYALSICQIDASTAFVSLRNSIFSLFLHDINPMHLLGNMIFLWIFAPRVEEYLGSRRFLAFYVLAGVAATLVHALLRGGVCEPNHPYYPGIIIGASGAVAGVMGALLFIKPMAKIRTAFIVFRVPVAIVNVYAFLFVGLWVGIDLFNIMTAVETGVAHWAHVGGFFAGFGMIFLAAMFKPVPSGLFDDD